MSIGPRPGITAKLTPIAVSGKNVTFRLEDEKDAKYFQEELNNELVAHFRDSGDDAAGAATKQG